MSRDPLDDVSRTLFASARREEPDQALLERVLGLDESVRDERGLEDARTNVAPGAKSTRRLQLHRPALGVWLAALAACGLAVLGKNAWDGRETAPRISAERPGTSPRAAPSSQAPQSAPAAEPAEAPRAADRGPLDRRLPDPNLADPDLAHHTVPPAAPPRTAVPVHAPAKPERAPSTPRATPLAEPHAAAQVTPQPALLAEVNLLKQARTALRGGDASLALSLLDRYSGELHGTDLNAEATLLRVETLTALDRRNDAAQLAERFVAENPDSPLVDRARSYLKARGTPANVQTP